MVNSVGCLVDIAATGTKASREFRNAGPSEGESGRDQDQDGQ